MIPETDNPSSAASPFDDRYEAEAPTPNIRQRPAITALANCARPADRNAAAILHAARAPVPSIQRYSAVVDIVAAAEAARNIHTVEAFRRDVEFPPKKTSA